MKETVDTLGNQKKMNYALRADMTREEFVQEVTDGLLPPPAYFPLNVKMNKEGYESIAKVLAKSDNALSPDAFETAANETSAVILDLRNREDFKQGFVPRSIYIGLDGSFAPWVGALIKDTKQPILLVVDEARVEEAVTRLSRVGFDNTLGFLAGGIQAWRDAGKDIDTLTSIPATELEAILAENADANVFDVRKPGEFQAEHIDGAKLAPLDFLNDYLATFPKEDTFYVHCAGGYRSVIAASILKARGYHNLIDIDGGYAAIKKTNIPVTDYVCPSTLK
jgi:rhodanese-related sulfurtransferase